MTIIKLLILSDSHGDLASMIEVVEREHPNQILHLGDNWRDGESLSFAYPELPVIIVPGNCDFSNKPQQVLLEQEGVRILMGHGHQWRVKSGIYMALEAAKDARADILLYGHTHMAKCWEEWPGFWVMNPGSVGGVSAPATYGVIELNNGKIKARLKNVEQV